MTILDKVIAAVTPPESDEARANARQQARASATPGTWFAAVLDHHVMIETSFEAVRAASDAGSRRAAERQLALILTGHSLAEEVVLYPAMARGDEKAKSEMSYVEQSAAKVQLSGLEVLDPLSQDYLDKLEHLRGAVLHHMYEEEDSRFPKLLGEIDAAEQSRLTLRYSQEYDRYVGSQPGFGQSKSLASSTSGSLGGSLGPTGTSGASTVGLSGAGGSAT